VTLSKSISGYGLPMALVLIKPKYDQWEPAEHNGTFRGNTHAFVTAHTTIEKYWSDDSFSESINKRIRYVTLRLQQISQNACGSQLKGRGMMQGIDVGSGKLAGDICNLCFEKGLICETSGPNDEVIKIFAALNIPMDLLEKGLNILEQATIESLQKTSKNWLPLCSENHNAIRAESIMRGTGALERSFPGHNNKVNRLQAKQASEMILQGSSSHE